MNAIWDQGYYVWGQGLPISAAIAAIPTIVLLYLLAVKRTPAWVAGLSGLAITVIVALAGYHMPVSRALSSAAYGAAFGLFPISWIVFWAIVLYNVAVDRGKFEIIRDSIGSLTSDLRIQALLIAFAFGAFIEGAAGFGTPVAVAGAMMVGLGFSPYYAAALCLLANYRAGGFRLDRLAHHHAGGRYRPSSAQAQRRGGQALRAHRLDPSRLLDSDHGRSRCDARDLACRPGNRSHLRSRAVSGLELCWRRAYCHPEFVGVNGRIELFS